MSRQQSNDFERDAELTALYRAAPAEEPPAALDDAIRAAARREVRAGPASADATRRRWYVPVSIAAVVVLSFTVVTLMKEGSSRIRTGASTTGCKWQDGAVSGARR